MKQYEKCKHCCECIYYEKCAVNAPYRMECNQLKKILCGFTVCCEDFISRKSIGDFCEEQKNIEN